jgi:hypothetical protein
MRSSINEMKRVRSISPVAIGTTGTGQTGKIVDRRPTVSGSSPTTIAASRSRSTSARSPRPTPPSRLS